jgi:hypothetical protein
MTDGGAAAAIFGVVAICSFDPFAVLTLSNAEGLRMTKWGGTEGGGSSRADGGDAGCSFAPFDYAQGRQPNP